MQKELGRYLLPVFRKKYNTVRHLKKYPPKKTHGFFLSVFFFVLLLRAHHGNTFTPLHLGDLQNYTV